MLAAAIALALAYWGPSTCQTVVHVQALPGDVLGQTYNYNGEWCEVQVDARRWRWGLLCSTILHEYGHAHGRGHSPGVMSPVLVGTLEPCRGKRPARYRPGARILLTAP